MEQEVERWITYRGKHIPIGKDGKIIEREDRIAYRGHSEENEYGVLKSGTFLTNNEMDASNYGKPEKYIIDKEANIYEGRDTREYANSNNLMDIKSEELKNTLGVETLKEVQDIYENWKTPSYLDKNPNLYFYAFQYMTKEDLNKKGFDGAYWSFEDDLIPNQYQIWNKGVIRK